MFRLLHHPISAGSRYIRLILGEYGQSGQMVEEKFWQRRAEFMKMSPAGVVPVLTDQSGEPMAGGLVIGEFFDETVGAMMREKRLMPENPHSRAEVRRLCEWFLVKVDAEVHAPLVGERVIKQLMTAEEGGGPPDSNRIRAGRNNLANHMQYLNWLAASRNWLAGTRFSSADLAAAASVSVLDYLGEISWDKTPAAKEWYARVKSRPSFRPLLADKIPGLPPVAHYIDLDF